MFTGMRTLLAAWFLLEPAASLLVCVAAVLLGSVTFIRLRKNKALGWSFGRTLLSAFLQGVMLIGVTGVFYFLLNSSYRMYSPAVQSLAQGDEYLKEVQTAQKNWGDFIVQDNLTVVHTYSHEEIQQVPGPDGKTFYVNNMITENIEQETITGFNGVVDLRLTSPYLNTYEADVVYQYKIVNQSDMTTTAHFSYPIKLSQNYRNLLVTINGVDLGSSKELAGSEITWEREMQPHQSMDVAISYHTQGMGGYVHKIRSKDVVQDFFFSVNTDTRNLFASTLPETSAIKFASVNTEKGYRLTWTIDRAILSPELGIRFAPGYTPDLDHDYALQLTRYAPRAIMLLMVVFVFTMLICGVNVVPWKLLLLAAIFSSQFLALLGLDLVNVNGWLTLPLLFIITFVLVRIVYRDLPRLPFTLVMASVVLFALFYPYAGLLPKGAGRTAFDAIMQSLIILYIFGLSLYMRVRNTSHDLNDG
ncbi:MAG: hypothetical protein IPP66_14650 [Anaerolineales bacterium]|nr:hypothetical protein [Anaerolineales bacterium]